MESKLMPCKCGGEVEKFESRDDTINKVDFGVRCMNCGMNLTDTIFTKTKPTKLDWTRVEKAWNAMNRITTMTNEPTSMDFEIDKTVGNEGEYGVKFNEPTTGEIVRALRCDGDANNCINCRYATYDTATILCDQEQNVRDAADRLESQEAQIKQLTEALAYANEWHKESVENATNELRELSGNTGELERFRAFHERYAEQTSKKYVEDICALTARAEKAEAERDAAVAVIGIQAKQLKESHVVLCNICKFEDMIGCVHKNHCDGYQLFKWRGLPQDGEGV